MAITLRINETLHMLERAREALAKRARASEPSWAMLVYDEPEVGEAAAESHLNVWEHRES